jgi:hypothetical protein
MSQEDSNKIIIMKAQLRADLRGYGELIPVLLPDEGKYVREEDIEKSEYIGYIKSTNSKYDGLELLLIEDKLIAVYSIDLDVTEGA